MVQAMHCIVVDDDDINRMLLKEVLDDLGYQTSLFESGEEALTYCKNNTPDFILLDYRMPNMNGLSFMQELRKSAFHSLTPVIMCTAENDEKHFRTLIREGAQGYLIKPFMQKELIKQLHSLGLYIQQAAIN